MSLRASIGYQVVQIYSPKQHVSKQHVPNNLFVKLTCPIQSPHRLVASVLQAWHMLTTYLFDQSLVVVRIYFSFAPTSPNNFTQVYKMIRKSKSTLQQISCDRHRSYEHLFHYQMEDCIFSSTIIQVQQVVSAINIL